MPASTTGAPLAPIDTAAAIAREKSLFVARNAERCSHLLVRIEAEQGADITIRAAFTLDDIRVWHQAEAVVSQRDLTTEAGPDRGLIAAFGLLDDGIGAARIAHLFAPLSTAERLAVGRS